MVNYSRFKNELEWYANSDNTISEVNALFAGPKENFDEILEEVEQKFPHMTRVQQLIGQASFVDRETRFYKSAKGDKAWIAIYSFEDIKSKIVVSNILSYSAMVGSRIFKVNPTTDHEKKIENDVLYNDQEWSRRD